MLKCKATKFFTIFSVDKINVSFDIQKIYTFFKYIAWTFLQAQTSYF